jgi:phospho-N-acetylmuramoyl-pentapeptide-transferase
VLFWLFYDVLSEVDALSFLRVFRYPSTRLLAAAVTALLISFLLGPWFIERMRTRQFGQQIRDDGPESHKKKAGTPTMGGSLILLAMVAPTLLWCDLTNRFVWLALAVTVAFGFIGFMDDYLKVSKKNTKGLPGKLRLTAEFVVAIGAMLVLFGTDTMDPSIRLSLQLPFTNFYESAVELPLWAYVGFASIVVVGAANAVNLTDGLDGLAIGPSIINAGTFGLFAYLAGSTTTILIVAGGVVQQQNIAEYLLIAHIGGVSELAIFAAAMVGAGIGFPGTTPTRRRSSWATSARCRSAAPSA